VISTSATRKAWYKEELVSTMDIKDRTSDRADMIVSFTPTRSISRRDLMLVVVRSIPKRRDEGVG
jgi:hypothetical protein